MDTVALIRRSAPRRIYSTPGWFLALYGRDALLRTVGTDLYDAGTFTPALLEHGPYWGASEWVVLNPIADPRERRTVENCTCRFMMFEQDNLDHKGKPDAAWSQVLGLVEQGLPMPASAVWSGSKSMHLIYDLGREVTHSEYKVLHGAMCRRLEGLGFKADRSTSNPNRLTRIGGVFRSDKGAMQTIYHCKAWPAFDAMVAFSGANMALADAPKVRTSKGDHGVEHLNLPPSIELAFLRQLNIAKGERNSCAYYLGAQLANGGWSAEIAEDLLAEALPLAMPDSDDIEARLNDGMRGFEAAAFEMPYPAPPKASGAPWRGEGMYSRLYYLARCGADTARLWHELVRGFPEEAVKLSHYERAKLLDKLVAKARIHGLLDGHKEIKRMAEMAWSVGHIEGLAFPIEWVDYWCSETIKRDRMTHGLDALQSRP